MEDHNLNTVLKLKLKPLHYANEIEIANYLQHMSKIEVFDTSSSDFNFFLHSLFSFLLGTPSSLLLPPCFSFLLIAPPSLTPFPTLYFIQKRHSIQIDKVAS